jgi:hypothetical protein
MNVVAKMALPTAFERAAYLRAKVLDNLASQCHEQSLLFDSLNHEEMADAYREASAALNEEARKLFPLYPHPGFMAGQQWARDNGFHE